MDFENNSPPTVLMVDDEPDLLALYEAWLQDICTVWTANNGETALEQLDETVDVVFLDRRMPDYSGDEVLQSIREQGYECYVAMLTAIQPEEDIVNLPFDDYLTKPVSASDLKATVDVLLQREAFDEQSQQLFALVSKKAALEASEEVDHTTNDEYDELLDRIDTIQSRLNTTIEELIEHDYSAVFREIERA